MVTPKKDSYIGIGLMSGTSLDGLDICVVEFKDTDFNILKAETIPYSERWQYLLRQAFYQKREDLAELDSEYGTYLGQKIIEFITQHNIEHFDFIASHGHTIFHQPQQGWTLQIGNGNNLHQTIFSRFPNHIFKVINNFRQPDIDLGGQGAPLVPIGDKLLFNQYDACLNIGGFANISYDIDNHRIAYDICAANTILNDYSNQLGHAYDKDGHLAKSGSLISKLYNELNELEYYNKNHPKSLGVEWNKTHIYPKLKDYAPIDILRTWTQHIAFQIKKELLKLPMHSKILITGGGAKNTYLMELIEDKHYQIIIPESKIVDYKEALIFAYLGYLRLLNKNNVLSSVTGASHDHSSGDIFPNN